MESFPEIALHRAQLQPDGIACRFFKGAGLAQEVLTFASLFEHASGLARHLQAQGLSGQRAVLVCKSQKNFVITFYACLFAGVVAVPASPPRRQALQSRLQHIVRDADARAILFDSDDLANPELAFEDDALVGIDVRDIAQDTGLAYASWRPVIPQESAPAFLQYTSGSTGDPKGVVVTHGNLVHNCATIQDAMELSPDSRLFTALPLFHDMGLVGGVLQFMYSGCSAGFMSPAEFVQYPERWLQIISRFGITVSGGPNFMYDLAARTIQPGSIEGVDLSTWRVAFCGAEPIRAAVIARFTERFASHGFNAGAFYPCYGMAESTLLITGARVGMVPSLHPHEGTDVVGCGLPRRDARVEIVDPDTCTRMPPGGCGEIWVSGRSVADGYWMRPELNEQVFRARIAGVGDGAPWLRTGDLGFMQDGQLYVTGRLKDLIIVNGRKYVPQDIEDRCERSHDALRQSGGAAFGVRDGNGERLVVVFELKREWLRRHPEWPVVLSAMRTCVSAEYGLPVSDIVLLRPGALPRTSSGKVRRRQCATDYLTGALERVAAA
ncbi:fatty acyl-AMP ligase [Agrilutibacter solisilvae]|uniref:Fatty acyl-AMP ligase n=1 Tax=Agrilutibacter solisilvae TaxID=2763317 RepID=A0A975ATX6_9GAMM|nr:fatty acyl-AMP ligase [Lysobacter solisilvae]QSX79614.1 fatty acyl-AMP ligase [Lysobacter solisilvae]